MKAGLVDEQGHAGGPDHAHPEAPGHDHHGPDHDHGHAHDAAHTHTHAPAHRHRPGHDHAARPLPAPSRPPVASLLMSSALLRLAGAVGLGALLWAAVAWALSGTP